MKIQTEEGIFDTELEKLYADNFIKENKIKAVAFILELEPINNIKALGEKERFKQICYDYYVYKGVSTIRTIFLTDNLLETNFKNIKNRDYVKDDGCTFNKGIVLKISRKEQDIKNAYWFCNENYDSLSDFLDEKEDSKIKKIEWDEFIKEDFFSKNISDEEKKEEKKLLKEFEDKSFTFSVLDFLKDENKNVCSFLDNNMFNIIKNPNYVPKKHLWTYNIYGENKNENMQNLATDNGNIISYRLDNTDNWKSLMVSDDLKYLAKKDTSVSCTLDSLKCKKTKQSNNNSIMENLKNKIKSQFIPEKVNGFKLSVDGIICMKSKDTDEEYVGINNDNELITYPSNMCIDFPMYVMSKSYNDIKVGDIVDTGSCFAKVLKKNGNNSLSCLTFNGTNKNSKTATDFLLKQPLVKVLFNILDGNSAFSNGQNNNLALAMIFSEENGLDDSDNIAKMMMYSQLANGNSDKSNTINPFVLSLLFNKEGNKLDSFQDIIMASAISGNGNGIFGNLFGQNNTTDEPKKDVEYELEELKKNYAELLKEVKKEKKETKTTKK